MKKGDLSTFLKVDQISNVSDKTSIQNTSFTISFKRTMHSPFIFVKNLLPIYERYGVDVSGDVPTPKAIRCAKDKIFWCFDISDSTCDS